MNTLNKCIRHFITITKHKYYVTRLCFKCGYYKRGLLHDLSKYGPTEFLASAKYWQGSSSPIDAEKVEKGYSMAWFHHKGHNPHHWEYWIDNLSSKQNTPHKIPYEYVVEMVCDWIAAGIVYGGHKVDFNTPYSEPLEYHEAHKHERLLHEDTEFMIDTFLIIIEEFGVNAFCEMARCFKDIY